MSMLDVIPDVPTIDPLASTAKAEVVVAPAKETETKEPATGAEKEPVETKQDDDPEMPAKLEPWQKALISKEKNARRAAEARADEKDRQLSQALEALNKVTPKHEAPEAKAPEAPKPEDFNSDAEYYKAATKFEVAEAIKAHDAAREADAARRSAETAAQTTKQRFDASLEAAKAKNADFADVISTASSPVTAAMRDAIVDSTIGGEILYHLAKHKGEAERIAALPAIAAIREIGKIEAAIVARPAAKPAVSSAPAPVNTVGTANTVDRSLADIAAAGDYKAYEAARRQQEKRR